MKIFVLFLCAIALGSCSSDKSVDTKSGVFVEQNLNEFITDNPDWTKDEATETATTDKFKHQAIKWSNEPDFLKDMPLQLKRIADTTESGQAVKMAHFTTFNDKTRLTESLLNYVNLHIKGIISNQQANQLALNKKYILTGNLQRQGKRADVKFIKVSDFRGYDIGSYTFLITEFKPL